MWHTYGRPQSCIQDFRERDHLEDLRIDGRIILKCNFRKLDMEEWTGLIWLRIGKGGGLLGMR